MTPETDRQLQLLLKALTELVKLANDAIKKEYKV